MLSEAGLENHWVCLPHQSRAKPSLPCTQSAECTCLKLSPAAGKQRNKQIRTNPWQRKEFLCCQLPYPSLLFSALSP